MLGTILIEDFKALPDRLIFEHIDYYKKLGISSESMKETLDRVDDTIIKPILGGSIVEMDLMLKSSLVPFYLELIRLNIIMLAGRQERQDITAILETEDSLFNAIKEFITEQTKYIEINEQVVANILQLLSQLRGYDNIILAVAFTEPRILAEALNVVDINELRASLSGASLAFLCILTFLKNRIRDPEKLAKLVKMDEEYTDVIGSWADAIGILGTPKEKIKVIANTLPIVGGIGTIKQSGLDIDLSKMEKGKSYAVDFRSSKYELEKDENGNLVLKEVG